MGPAAYEICEHPEIGGSVMTERPRMFKKQEWALRPVTAASLALNKA
jgi:hypothetical protein